METPKIEGGNVPAEVKVEAVIAGGAVAEPAAEAVIAGGAVADAVEGGVTTRRGTRTSPRRSHSKKRRSHSKKRRSHRKSGSRKGRKHSYPRHKKHTGGSCPKGKLETKHGNCVKPTSTAIGKSRRACKKLSKTRNSAGRCVTRKEYRSSNLRRMFRGGEVVDKVVVEPTA